MNHEFALASEDHNHSAIRAPARVLINFGVMTSVCEVSPDEEAPQKFVRGSTYIPTLNYKELRLRWQTPAALHPSEGPEIPLARFCLVLA